MQVIVTASSGLIGSELVTYFDQRAERVVGVDSNMRAEFFRPDGDTGWNPCRRLSGTRRFVHRAVDVRDGDGLARLFRSEGPFDLVIHRAARSRAMTSRRAAPSTTST